ncbi:MAG: sensor histidine kinase [Anaerolineaceae bacterium]|nr:MAG: sensor histidine kinase [Anaerolineaceae bacterium]
MYNCKDIKNITDDLKEFIINLIDENENSLSQIADQKRICHNDISEKEAFIHTIKETNNKSSNLFSPISKDYNIEDYYNELDDLKEKLDSIEKEEKKLNASKIQLMEIKRTLLDQERPHFSMGINILELQEQDRQRIARDLHDSTVQNLTSLIHKSELCLRLVDMDPVRTKLELNTISNTLKAVINEIREIIYNLKPMSLDDLGLLTTIERYVNQLMMNHDIKVNLTHNKENHDILPVIKLSIFRMIQEACNNAIKHADAKTISIDILYGEKNITLSIRDDGRGFETESRKDYVAPDYSGYGLSIMKERVYLLAGSMKIQSTINKGTIVTITVPITKSEGEE